MKLDKGVKPRGHNTGGNRDGERIGTKTELSTEAIVLADADAIDRAIIDNFEVCKLLGDSPVVLSIDNARHSRDIDLGNGETIYAIK